MSGATGVQGRPAPPWYSRQQVDSPDEAPLSLAILHWDQYPTAREVYRRWFPQRGHRVLWFERGPRGSKGFDASGDERLTTILCPFPAESEVELRPLRVLQNRWRRLRATWSKAWRVYRECAAWRPDYVQARDLVAEGLMAYVVAKLIGARFSFQLDFPHYEGYLLLHEDDGGLRMFLRKLDWRSSRAIRNWLMRRADPVFVISEVMREDFLGRGLDPTRTYVFPVGVDRRFADAADRRDEIRTRLGVGDAPVVTYVGNLGFTRDRDRIFRIFREVASRVPEARFLVLGQNCEDLEGLLARHGIADRTVYAGTVAYADVPAYLCAADIGVYPIDVDLRDHLHASMSPLKVAEYMASGCATVASPNPEAVQLLRDSEGGIVIDSNADAEFVRAIRDLCGDPERRTSMGANARRYVLQYKEFEVLSGVVENAYRPASRIRK